MAYLVRYLSASCVVLRFFIGLLASLVIATGVVQAQPAPPPSPAQKSEAAKPSPQKPDTAKTPQAPQPGAAAAPPGAIVPSQGSVVPQAQDLLVMIRSSLLALHHANLTGNYTVLRDLGAPGFQSANSAARLSDIFRSFRSSGIDLTKCVLVTPQLAQPPGIDSKGRLRLKGLIEISPTAVYFDLLYLWVGETWKLFGISVAPRELNNGSTTNSGASPPAKPTSDAAPSPKPAPK